MKVIVKIKPSGKCLRRLLRHVYLPEGRLPREVEPLLRSGSRVLARINGMTGGMTFQAADDAHNLAGDIKGRGEYRHVILSAEDCANVEERRTMFRGLMAMGKEWARKYAPDTPFVGVVHDDRAHPHIHLILKNEGADGRCLSWGKDQVREMQSMGWVSEATRETFGVVSGRGCGQHTPEYSDAPYPLAKSLDAKTIAGFTQEQINEYTNSGTLQTGRVNQRGDITSVIYNGRRIRLSTIRGLGELGGCGFRSEPSGGSEGPLRKDRGLIRYRPPRRTRPYR
jgi:hypothetical protein